MRTGLAAPPARWPAMNTALKGAGVAAGCVATGYLLASAPFAISGLILGVALFALTLARPLVIIGLMLATGPIDLSFATGGLKALLPALGGLDMNGIRLIVLLAGFTSLALVDRDVLGGVLGRYGRWYVLFLAFAAATLAWTSSPNDGARLLLKLAYPLLVFAVVLGVGRTRGDYERLGAWMLVGAVLIAGVLNPLYLMVAGWHVMDDGTLRAFGLGAHANPFSFYLLLMLIFGAARYTARGERRYLALAPLLLVWLVLTFTRITLLAAVVGVGAFMLYAALVARNYRAVRWGVVLGAAVAIPLVPIVLERTFGYIPGPAEIFDVVRDPVRAYGIINWQGRELLWAVLAGEISASPWIGHGLGSSALALRQAFQTDVLLVAHNEYLRLWAEIGLAGCLLFAFALAGWLRGAFAAGRASPLAREYALLGVSGLLVWAVVALTDNPLDYYNSFTQYVAFACAAAIGVARLDARDAEAAQALETGEHAFARTAGVP
jgi:O-antigen ligase